MPKSKKFIDKKKSVSFHLVPRSVHDPLSADPTGSSNVLHPVTTKQSKKDDKKEEERKFGVFFDDDYNYLQHLKPKNEENNVEWEEVTTVQEKPRIQLPSSVFASKVVNDVGFLVQSAPRSGLQLDLDPDIVAAMDEDFDFDNPENELDDDFFQLADQIKSDHEDISSENDVSSQFDEEEEYNFQDEETKSRFTEYSMSSSVLPRTSHLQILDEQFEQMFATYDDDQIGALDGEDIDESFDNEKEKQLLARTMEKEQFNVPHDKPESDENVRDITLRLAEIIEEEEENGEEMVIIEVPQKPKYDCETILSTYSNIYNHPKIIDLDFPKKSKIEISSKTGLPTDTLDNEGGKLTARNLNQLNKLNSQNQKQDSDEEDDRGTILSILSIRDKNETLEEKRKRKHDLKEYRKVRREIRKANTLAFKKEKKCQEKMEANKSVPIHSQHFT